LQRDTREKNSPNSLKLNGSKNGNDSKGTAETNKTTEFASVVGM
jgi:hypothetical protein